MSSLILVVDDEPAICDVLANILRDEDYAVRTAANGREALALHGATAADVILTDVMMPELDGYGLVAELRARGDGTPVILMSADPIAGSGDGVACIEKPFDLETLLDQIATALTNR
jgi:two-component system, OmpR family, response regulator